MKLSDELITQVLEKLVQFPTLNDYIKAWLPDGSVATDEQTALLTHVYRFWESVREVVIDSKSA